MAPPGRRLVVGHAGKCPAGDRTRQAKQQQQNLTTNGIATYTENIKTEKGEVTRVRIGPFSVRSEAEEMRNRLKGLGINGVVTAP